MHNEYTQLIAQNAQWKYLINCTESIMKILNQLQRMNSENT